MINQEKEEIIKTYFNMWVKRDFTKLDEIFCLNIYYSECYGPEYFGMSEILLWIDDMLKKQKVLDWEIKSFFHNNTDTVVVEWNFQEQINSEFNDFDGVSIIKFSSDGKIASIKEFESKSSHIAPYH